MFPSDEASIISFISVKTPLSILSSIVLTNLSLLPPYGNFCFVVKV
jgi:hypothetical protein